MLALCSLRRWRPVVAGAVLAVLLAGEAAATDAPAPIVIEPGGAGASGRLEVTPAVTKVTAGPDGAVVTHTVRNGAETALDLTLEAVAVEVTPDGPKPLDGELGEAAGAGAGNASQVLRIPTGSVHLEPGAVATVRSGIAPTTSSQVVALGVHGTGPATALGLVVVDPPDAGTRDVEAVDVDVADDRVRIELASDSPWFAVADLRVRVRPLLGPAVLDRTVHDLLVPPDGGRTVDLEAAEGWWPGPYRLEVVVAHDGEEPARLSRTFVPERALTLTAAVLLGVAVLLTTLVWRRRRTAATPPKS